MKMKQVFSIVILLSVISFAGAGSVQGATCKALRQQINKERRMIQKRNLIKKSLVTCPNDPVINYDYGYSFERFRKYEDALKYYNRAIKNDPKFAKGYFGKGDVQSFLGNYREAITAYETGLKFASGKHPRVKESLVEAKAKFRARGGVIAEPKKAKTVVAKAKPPVVTAKKIVKKAPPRKVSYAEAPILRLQVPFFKKSANLSRDAMDQLDIVVGQSMRRSSMRDAKFEVIGHTDNLGKAADNMNLSKKRAEVVKRYLLNNFKIGSDRLTIAFYGQNRPKIPNTSTQNRIANRRVEFRRAN